MSGKDLIKLLRVDNYIKNLFIIAPLFFSGMMSKSDLIIDVIIVAVLFSITSSSIYILNDIIDIDFDRNHPKKRLRPIPSGKIKISNAILLAVFLCVFSLIAVYLNYKIVFIYLLIYLILNIFYCLYGKRISIVDIFIISIGFVIRIKIGSCVGNVELSHWLIIMTFLVALFIAINKRKDDIILLERNGILDTRSSSLVDGYNRTFIQSITNIVISSLSVCYTLYCIDFDTSTRSSEIPIYYSLIFVLLGLFRYLQLSEVYEAAGDPIGILKKDKFIIITVLSWILYFTVVIYFK
jgi:decaprenyl-phosphate phosphoribosyltransferase